MNNKKGSVAVFLMLILTAVLSVTAILYEGACSAAAKSISEGLGDLAGRSSLSEYHRGLKEDYGLFALYADEEKISEDLKYYIGKSLDGNSARKLGEEKSMELIRLSLESVAADTTEYSFIMSEVPEAQILDFMKYRAVYEGLDLLKQEEEVREGLIGSTAASENLQEKVQEAKEAEKRQEEEDRKAIEQEEENEGGVDQDAAAERHKRKEEKKKLKELILGQKKKNEGWWEEGDDSRVLRNQQEKNVLPSANVELKKNFDIADLLSGDVNQIMTDGRNSVYLNEYILLHFSDRVRNSSKKETFFENEVEYILCGHDNDKANLRQVRVYLFTLRTSLNLLHIYQDSQKNQLTLQAAMALAPGPGAPAVQLLIASLWAGAESERDLKDLLSGKNVPIIKRAEDWKLGLNDVMTAAVSSPSEETGRGQSYTDYLKLFLMVQSREARVIRLLDLIQLNLRLRWDKGFLVSDYCGGFAGQISFTRRMGLFPPFASSGGYTIEKIQKY